jgi:acyl dehydratase
MCCTSGSPIEGRVMNLLHFEDFPLGEVFEFGDRLVTAEEIVAFARDYDPQPFHLDAEAAKGSQAGGLIASGWHTAVLLMRMSCDAFLNRAAGEGGPGVEELKWVKPVRPNDRLHVRRTTLAARVSHSRPALGIVDFLFEVFNQNGEVVMTQKNTAFVRRREAAEAAP